MFKITLDWNCVIEVEQAQSQAEYINNLVAGHRNGEFEVALLAASASENTKSRVFPGNAQIFQQRVEQLGWSDLPLVPMPGVFGLSYFDSCFFVEDGGAFEKLKLALWQVIAPRVNHDPARHLPIGVKLTDDTIQSEELSKWRNTWCDVISAYSHIHAERDLFVTSNTKDFQANASALSELGMKHIAKPDRALALIDQLRG